MRHGFVRRWTCGEVTSRRMGGLPVNHGFDLEFDLDDEDAVLTAYHEAGHAVIAAALGASIDVVSLSQASAFDDLEDGPTRFGDCLVDWGRVDAAAPTQRMKELWTVLAGPAAEFVYANRELDPAHAATWQEDFRHARRCAAALTRTPSEETRLLRQATRFLTETIASPGCWDAVAALADELVLGDPVDGQRVAELVRFWWAR